MRYYIIAGEASGDLHGSNLILALKERDKDAVIRCWGGDLMQRAGGELVMHYRDLAYMGFWEVLVHLRTIMRNLRSCERDLHTFQPDVLILIDYPGFNLRMAKFARRNGIKVFYYISPQLWAWKSSRVKTIKECVSKMFVILPFEPAFYNKFDYQVDFVGHPLLDAIHSNRDVDNRDIFLERNNLPDKPIIALLPGSRKQEIRTMLRRMIEVIPYFMDHQFLIAGAPSISPELYHSIIKDRKLKIITGQTYDLLGFSEAALVTSGTATLEAALLRVPEVVCYKGSALSFWIARRIVKVNYISLVNLVMGREVVKELVQNLLTKKNLIHELTLLFNPAIRTEMKGSYEKLTEKLGGRGASARTAELIIQYLTDN